MGQSNEVLVGTHWGDFLIASRAGQVTGVRPAPHDENPSGIGPSILDISNASTRIAKPMVRKGYYEKGRRSDGGGRGREPFVEVSWDTALDLAADAIDAVRKTYGNESIFGGSYGWSSAGRFHHAQSQVHRFLNLAGGYVDSRNTYSAAAAEVIVPHIIGLNPLTLLDPNWEEIAEHCQMFVAFGGICPRNNQVVPGGIANHSIMRQLKRVADAGVEMVSISPLREDTPDFMRTEWLAPRPVTDVALMLGLAHTLFSDGTYDRDFLRTHCVGFDAFLPYLTGEADGVAKSAEWAAEITGLSAETIRDLARRMVGKRVIIGISLSLQRAEHGEQVYWMATALAAMLGQIGLAGGGVGYAWGSNGRGYFGRRRIPFKWGSLDQFANPVKRFIPVARIADMLMSPGKPFDYNGQRLEYADIRLVYWAGGNPFHHHQDLNRLRRAWARPETIIVNESVWTSTARFADIVFPVTTFAERNDIVCGLGPTIVPSRKAVEPFGESRNDHDVLAGLAARLGFEQAFTEGRGEMEWLGELYRLSRESAARAGVELPDFETFWAGEGISVHGQLEPTRSVLKAFRNDPEADPLPTPSGKIEIYSETIASFGYDDCPGHPVWLDKQEWLGSPNASRFPIHLLSPQPENRLHSQLDFGRASTSSKIDGREPLQLNAEDAAERGIATGDIVRIYNDRGACLAGAVVSDSIARGVAQLPTGAWYDPAEDGSNMPLDRHGNPNVICMDAGTSKLAQGPSAQSCLVQIEKFVGEAPAVRAFSPPAIIREG